MRTTLFFTTLFSTALFACTTEVKSTDFRAADGGVPQSGDGGVKSGTPAKSPSTSKDAGTGTNDPDPTPGGGPTTCKVAVECLGECAEDDEACAEACYASLPAAELGELEDVATCIANSNCETDECLAEVCAEPINACLGN